MQKFNNKFMDFGYLIYRWINPVFDILKFIRSFPGYFNYFKDLVKYLRIKDNEKIKIIDTYPCIHDKTQTTNFDSHYFYQDIWAFGKIQQSKTELHIDVGSRIDFVGFLTVITRVIFIDIRPLLVQLEKFESRKGSILSLPFESGTISSLSCLHVAEHIGLGRYGDKLDADGTKKACKELSRVLAPKGNLYFSLPVGKPRLCFNAHRIHSPQQIMEYFADLKLVEISGIDDKINYKRNIDITILENSDYACGLFHFTKE
ncbi:MAG: DUF268 domain-containing protein [bacterium]